MMVELSKCPRVASIRITPDRKIIDDKVYAVCIIDIQNASFDGLICLTTRKNEEIK